MRTLKISAHSSLSLPPNSYIYSITPCGPAQPTSPSRQLTVISSDDSLCVLDAESLRLLQVISSKTHEEGGVTALHNLRDLHSQLQQPSYENLVATTGRDGTVRTWDVRSYGQPVLEMKIRASIFFPSPLC
jgi:WD repeat-containing protein 89